MNRIITFSLFSVSLIAPIVFLFSSFVASPLEYLIHYTGHSALVTLALVLLCSRLKTLNKYFDRKYIGLIAFIFTSVHWCQSKNKSVSHLIVDKCLRK